MLTVDIHELPDGSVIEIHDAEEFPVIKGRAPHAYVCADSQLRIVTMEAGAQIYGADTRADLYRKLTARGFRPIETS